VVATAPVVPSPLEIREDAAARRWLAARAMRGPLVALKFGSPVLTIATLAIIVNQPNLAAQPLDVLWALALPFGVPFFLALIYPAVRWTPQTWRLDATGLHGTGRVRGDCPWDDVASWSVKDAEGFPSSVHVVFRRAPAWRHLRSSMMVPAADRAAVEAWFRRAGGASSGSPPAA
jgi:hypothetical protein